MEKLPVRKRENAWLQYIVLIRYCMYSAAPHSQLYILNPLNPKP